MKLFVEPMDAIVVDATADGLVQLADGEWISPTFQERRAIIYAAENELAALRELLEFLGAGEGASRSS